MSVRGIIECKPEEVGYDSSRIDVLEEHFERRIAMGEIICATYCAARKGKVFMHGAVGKHSFEANDDTPAQPTDIQYIASATKTFTGVAIAQLVENGLTRFDVPVGEILPQFNTPPFNGISLYHLLTHTSGMHADGGCFENKYQVDYWDMVSEGLKNHLDKGGKVEDYDWIASALSLGVRTPSDMEWAYCSFGFVILGAVIEKLTGIHANKYIMDYIVKPLGMTDTYFYNDIPEEKLKRYIVQDEHRAKRLKEGHIPATDPMDIFWGKIMPSTAGGLNSTVFDMVRYGNCMLNNGTFNGTRILGRKVLEKMTSHQLTNMPNHCWGGNEKARGYGLGFDMRNGPQFTFTANTYMHEGAGACALYVDPAEELVAAWIVPYKNRNGDWCPHSVYNPQNIIWSGLI